VQQLAQNPDLLQHIGLDEHLLFAGARPVDVNGGVDPLLCQTPLEVHLHIARALELLVDHLVHARASLNQRRGDDGERAALFNVSCCAKEPLGPVQGVGIHTSGEHLARGGHHRVVGPGQTRDGVEQNDHILLVFDQALGLFNHHLCHLHMACGGLIKGGRHDLAAHTALHLRHLLGTLVDEQHDQGDIGVVGSNGVGDGLHHHRLAALGRSDEQTALAFADGGHHVDDSTGDVLLSLHVTLELQRLVGKEWGEVLKQNLVLGRLGRLAVDLVHLHQREVTLAILRGANLALNCIARVKVEAANLGRGEIDVVGACEVARLG